MKEFLSDHQIHYVEKNVAEDPEARDELINQYESMSTPTVVIGDEVIIGFNPDKMTQLLSLE